MAKHTSYSVILTYNQDLQQLIVCTVDANSLSRSSLEEWAWSWLMNTTSSLTTNLRDSLELECSTRLLWVSRNSSNT